MKHGESSANRQACVPGGRLDVDAFKRGVLEDFAVGDAIEGDSASQTKRLLPCLVSENLELREEDFFEPSLEACSYIAMAFLEGLARTARGTE